MPADLAPTPAAGRIAPPATAIPRVGSIDAYRGFVMLLMMAEVLRLRRVAQAFPDSYTAGLAAYFQAHVAWVGCSLHDLIQPSFSFLVGAVVPYSLASRASRGQSTAAVLGHALWRGLVLVLLGVFLRSVNKTETYWTFEDTLTQIGLGYPFLVALGLRSRRIQIGALAVLLGGYWAAWALYPLPAGATSLAAHWTKNANLGYAFDVWFLNLFPRAKPFVGNPEGYLTLSFIPTLGTMLLGLLAAHGLRDNQPAVVKLRRLLLAGLAGIASGLVLHGTGLCPLVKKIWTPGWTLFSGGICFVLLAGFYAAIDWRNRRGWAFPLIVIGANSITAYCLAHLLEPFITQTFRIHLGANFFAGFGREWTALLQGAAVLLVYWLILYWMYRRRLFVKI